MKKVFLILSLFILVLSSAFSSQNPLVDIDFWKTNPSLEDVQKELDKGVDINEVNQEFSITALTSAVYYSDEPEIIGFLLDNGADSHFTSDYYGCIWDIAGARGNAEITNYLINKLGMTKENYDCLRYGWFGDGFDDDFYDYLIDLAHKYDYEFRISPEYYLYNNAEIDVTTIDKIIKKIGWEGQDLVDLAIWTTIYNQDEELAKYYYNLGIDLFGFDSFFEQSFGEFLLGSITDLELIKEICNSIENITKLVPSQEEKYGSIYYAASKNPNAEVTKYLMDYYHLDEKAKYDVFIYSSSNPNSSDLFYDFINKGYEFKKNTSELEDCAAYYMAMYNQNPEFVLKYINDFKDQITEQDLIKMFHLATIYQFNDEVLKALLTLGIDINSTSTNTNGEETEDYTALMYAARYNNFFFSNIESLIDLGADVKMKNAKGETALDIIKKYNRDLYATPSYWKLAYLTYN